MKDNDKIIVASCLTNHWGGGHLFLGIGECYPSKVTDLRLSWLGVTVALLIKTSSLPKVSLNSAATSTTLRREDMSARSIKTLGFLVSICFFQVYIRYEYTLNQFSKN